MPASKAAGLTDECCDSMLGDLVLVGGSGVLIGDVELVTTHEPDPQHDACHPRTLRAHPLAGQLERRQTDALSDPVRVIKAGDLVAADPTSGMLRMRAFELPILWAGQVITQPGAISGWHHHDKNESSLYIVSGVLRLEFEGSGEYLDAVAGDFVHVPAFTIHRESNPSGEPSLAIIARAGGGIPTVNVDPPR